MRSNRGFRRAGWLGAVAMICFAPAALVADEPKPPASDAVEAATAAAKEAAAAAAEAAQAAAKEVAAQAKAVAEQAAAQAQEAAKAAAEEAKTAAGEAAKIAADEAKRAVAEIKKRKLITELRSDYQLGIQVAPVPKALDTQLELDGKGVLVDGVAPEGAAHKAGIKEHDVITNIGDDAVSTAADLVKAVAKSEGKEIEVRLIRVGKRETFTIRPEKKSLVVTRFDFPTEEVEVEIRKLEEKIREKLKDAGVDVRMQLIQPGKFLPANIHWQLGAPPELPEDLTIQIRKHGKEPAEIEVKKGDKTWSVKQDDLESLPDDVRQHVEHMLGHGPMRFAIAGKKFTVPVAPRDVIWTTESPQTRARVRGNLERRIDELSRDMDRMRERMNDLRGMLREEIDRDKD